MARFPAAKPILDAATHWRDRCLLGQGSVFTDQPLWTRENVQALVEHYANNLDAGAGTFLQKLETQLGSAPPDTPKLAAEMLWVMYLIMVPETMGASTKRKQVRQVWAWSGDTLPEDHTFLGSLLEDGVANTGAGYHTHRWREFLYFVHLMERWYELDRERKSALLGDAWAFQRWLDDFADSSSRQLRHILLFYLFPNTFERIASVNHKRDIVKRFRAEYALEGDVDYEDSGQLDRQILRIREEAKEQYGDEAGTLDFYLDPLASVWRGDDDPPALDDEAVQHARALFLRRFPVFESFEASGERFEQQERAYKDDLVRRWQAVASELPEPGDLTAERAAEITERLKELLSTPLETTGQPQNLISWRYTNFLRELDGPEKVTFVRALIALVRGEESSANRAGAFVQAIWPIMEGHGATGYAASRSVPTLLLFLSDPANEIYVRTDLFDSLASRLTGDRVFRSKRLDRREYARALGFAHAVKDALEQMGWPPRDMIDVQSFMWSVEQEWAADAKEEARDEGDETPVATIDGDADGVSFLALRQTLLDAGLYFPAELVANYVLALQTKRFVILTGISGTGKTQLAKQVGAHFAPRRDGDPEEPLVVAVRPDWTDPRGLIGYYNPITESYVPTEFLRLLLRARKEEDQAHIDGRPPQPFFVILDEMNLARVEHYFADFLSALESGSDLTLHHGTAGEGGDGASDAIPPTLRIPRNVFFTGTVNVDETTHMFSPKVLDRAFTLELSEVDLEGWTTSGAVPDTDAPGLDLPAMHARLRYELAPGAEDWDAFGSLLDGVLRDTVVALNKALTPSGYHFAYRVAGEIARFVRLAHAQGADSPAALWKALDLALLQKVLPKFHGTEQELQAPLEVVERLARTGRVEAESEDEEASGAGGGATARLPRCLAKVGRMQARLRARGFTAFIE